MSADEVAERYFDLSSPGAISGAGGGLLATYFVDDRDVAEGLWSSLPAVSADLIDFVLGVYLADRLAKTDTRGEFGRRIGLTLGMRLHERWGQGLTGKAAGLLAWLSGDAWKLEVVPYAGRGRASETGDWLLRQHVREWGRPLPAPLGVAA